MLHRPMFYHKSFFFVFEVIEKELTRVNLLARVFVLLSKSLLFIVMLQENQQHKSVVAQKEEEILSFWNTHNIFKKSLEKKQSVSNYEEKPEPKIDKLIIILLGVVIFLFIILIGLFIFRDSLLEFFNNLFS